MKKKDKNHKQPHMVLLAHDEEVEDQDHLLELIRLQLPRAEETQTQKGLFLSFSFY